MQNIPPLLKVAMVILVIGILVTYMQDIGPIAPRPDQPKGSYTTPQMPPEAPPTARYRYAPPLLVLDVRGDGPDVRDYNLATRAGWHVYRNIIPGGAPSLTSWIGPDDYILVADLNGNGSIDDDAEMLATPAPNGVSKLREFDTDGNGRITEQDPSYDLLRLCHDTNVDAQCSADELVTLQDAGITFIGYELQTPDLKHSGTARYAVAARASGPVFPSLPLLHVYLRYTPIMPVHKLPEAAAPRTGALGEMPGIAGGGLVPPLRYAMLHDKALENAAAVLLQTPVDRYADYMRAMQNLLFVWAGTADIPVDSRGQWIDARKLETIERFHDEKQTFPPDDRTDPMKYQSRLTMQDWWMKIYYPYTCPIFAHISLNGMSMKDLYEIGAYRSSLKDMTKERIAAALESGEALELTGVPWRKDADKNWRALVDKLQQRGAMDETEYRGYLSYAMHCMDAAWQDYTLHHLGQWAGLTPQPRWMKSLNLILRDAGVIYPAPELMKQQFVVDEIDHRFDTETLGDRLLYFTTIPYMKVFLPILLVMILAVYIAGQAKKRKMEKRR